MGGGGGEERDCRGKILSCEGKDSKYDWAGEQNHTRASHSRGRFVVAKTKGGGQAHDM